MSNTDPAPSVGAFEEMIERLQEKLYALDSDIEVAMQYYRTHVLPLILQNGNGAPPQSSIIKVPYRSQWDADGGLFASDCGPSSLAMVLQWLGVTVKIDDLAKDCGMSSTKRYTTGFNLVSAASKYGVSLDHRFDATPTAIENELSNGRPVIALLHYGTLKPYVQDKVYTSGHWLVVVGSDDDTVIVNDPNFKGAERERGFNLHIPRGVFEQAMKDNTIDGNRASQAVFVIAPKG